ncbi:unnamed protein product [Linum tenue]|uniref:PCI domain-containing protein n=1 Tax=Linum tenue TaxID=586396 RepID=A0AAV0P694_9ROSI|nr:unnamed protein product [Linum tenue]
MAFAFGKDAGPTGRGNKVLPFGAPAASQAPPLTQPGPPRSPCYHLRGPPPMDSAQFPPLGYGTPRFVGSHYPSARMPNMSESQRPQSFTWRSGISQSPASYPSLTTRPRMPVESPPRWGNGNRSFLNGDGQKDPTPYAVKSLVATRNSGTAVAAKVTGLQDQKRSRSPYSTDEVGSQNSSLGFSQRLVESPPGWGNGNQSILDGDGQKDPAPYAAKSLVATRNSGGVVAAKVTGLRDQKRTRSSTHYTDEVGSQNLSLGFPQRAAYSPPAWDDNNSRVPGSFPNLSNHQLSPGQVNEVTNGHLQKRSKSPTANGSFQGNAPFIKNERPFSPIGLNTQSDPIYNNADSQIPQRVLPSFKNTTAESSPTRNTSALVSKRTRSPEFGSRKVLPGSSFSTIDDTEREIQAKAKRLARFKEELSEEIENGSDIGDRDIPVGGPEQSKQRQNVPVNHSTEDRTNDNNVSDLEGLGTSRLIVGVCPDMCPESERGERERKGDLDQYERLDGDRNQTNRLLAVKKYTRTAEREAYLIRPMPVLKKTIDYLLSLLDQPYDGNFLGRYNFLWDRMRAIRMDLRMQHIFNLEAITMLEQMIRLHIIAMHELCEYTKGEGFSEGFDAHLNIEQMNKTSVELFQMYDDHRKKGINVPSEKEFRGYYALLKLDKHPGYKVEPSELSLDLAKMTPEIRQTPEVLFARDVARACRTGNFIAFFRLGKKATYLQACLMHAHFAKLRTHALASLYAGLQTNQGAPVSQVAKWLAMEEEDVETLLAYYGFSIKDFEEPYMVKEGPFLNSDKDFPTKRSRLVHLKKSNTIGKDILPSAQVTPLLAEATRKLQVPSIDKKNPSRTFTVKAAPALVDKKRSISAINTEMPDSQVVPSPKFGMQKQRTTSRSEIDRMEMETNNNNHVAASVNIAPWNFLSASSSPKSQPAKVGVLEKSTNDSPFPITKTEGLLPQPVLGVPMKESPPSGEKAMPREFVIHQIVVGNLFQDEGTPDVDQEDEDDKSVENHEDEEVARAKLKLFVRLWKRRVSRHKELRRQREMAANAAMSSLSLGPLIRRIQEQPSNILEFDIDYVMKERCRMYEHSWSRLNPSEIFAGEASSRDPDPKYLCWKLVLCSQSQEDDQPERSMHAAAGPWLCSKLIPNRPNDTDNKDELLTSSPGLSIWRKSVSCEVCCLSVVRNSSFCTPDEAAAGATAVVFVVSETIPMSSQRITLHNLLSAIHPSSSLPLVVFCGKRDRTVPDPLSAIAHELGLNSIDKSRIRSFSIVFLVGDDANGFFSDSRVREGLRWLASESPQQPDVQSIRLPELVLARLKPSLDALEKMNDPEVGPNRCISAFNEALDWSVEEILTAARANPTGWPCPELVMLEESEIMLIESYLPSIGWSSPSKTEPLISALLSCKLPGFADDLSWLDEGTANMGDELEKLSTEAENRLIRYLTESSGMMGFSLAAREAHVVLQRSARLEFRDCSSYHIVVNWVKAFRRVFNWQLNKLSSEAYVLRSHIVDLESLMLDEQGSISSPYVSQPSLDQVIHVGCFPLVLPRVQPKLVTSIRVSTPDVPATVDTTLQIRNGEQASPPIVSHGVAGDEERRAEVKTPFSSKPTTKEADKLSRLLEQCNIVQNSIEEKLSIYF